MSSVEPHRPQRKKQSPSPPSAAPPPSPPSPPLPPPTVPSPPVASPMAPFVPGQTPIAAPAFSPAPQYREADASRSPADSSRSVSDGSCLPGFGVAANGQAFPVLVQVPHSSPSKKTAAKPATSASRRYSERFSLEPFKPTQPAAVAVAAAEEEPPADATEVVTQQAPPFLISMLVHMALVIVLALITLHEELANHIQIEAVYADTTGQQLLDQRLQSPEPLDMQVDVPLLSFDIKPALDPLAAPPRLSDAAFDPLHGAANIDAPSIGLALSGREAGMKKALLPAYGGTALTEGSVLAGLHWLKTQQLKDGGWSLAGPYRDGAVQENRCSATAMALLAFQGFGVTHLSSGDAPPEFRDAVDRGWKFLLKMQNKDGQFEHEGSRNQLMYAQAQASIAVCEIYGMTKDEKFKRPAQLALDFAQKSQSPELGGWRYEPRFDSDTSVTGWFVMALQSGMMAGLEVQSPNLQLVNDFLDRVSLEGGSMYAYQVGGEHRLTMTAEALLCRQYLGWKHDDPRLKAGIELLLSRRIDYDSDPNVYYWYYATQACHHMDGDVWDRWNEKMREAIPAAQTKTGPDKGSWHASADRWGPQGGRLYVTCMSIFMLETYYRHLPIYKWRLSK